MARGVSKCPNCGEPVTPYTMGCSICGADIAAAREERQRRREVIPSVPGRPSWLPAGAGMDLLVAGALLALTLFTPMFGAVFAGLAAYKADRDVDPFRRNLCLAVLAIAVVLLIVIAVSPGSYFRLLFWLS